MSRLTREMFLLLLSAALLLIISVPFSASAYCIFGFVGDCRTPPPQGPVLEDRGQLRNDELSPPQFEKPIPPPTGVIGWFRRILGMETDTGAPDRLNPETLTPAQKYQEILFGREPGDQIETEILKVVPETSLRRVGLERAEDPNASASDGSLQSFNFSSGREAYEIDRRAPRAYEPDNKSRRDENAGYIAFLENAVEQGTMNVINPNDLRQSGYNQEYRAPEMNTPDGRQYAQYLQSGEETVTGALRAQSDIDAQRLYDLQPFQTARNENDESDWLPDFLRGDSQKYDGPTSMAAPFINFRAPQAQIASVIVIGGISLWGHKK